MQALSESSAWRYVHLVFAIFTNEKLAKKETRAKKIPAPVVLYKFHRILFMFLMSVRILRSAFWLFGLEFRLNEVVYVCLRFRYICRDMFIRNLNLYMKVVSFILPTDS